MCEEITIFSKCGPLDWRTYVSVYGYTWWHYYQPPIWCCSCPIYVNAHDTYIVETLIRETHPILTTSLHLVNDLPISVGQPILPQMVWSLACSVTWALCTGTSEVQISSTTRKYSSCNVQLVPSCLAMSLNVTPSFLSVKMRAWFLKVLVSQ